MGREKWENFVAVVKCYTFMFSMLGYTHSLGCLTGRVVRALGECQGT